MVIVVMWLTTHLFNSQHYSQKYLKFNADRILKLHTKNHILSTKQYGLRIGLKTENAIYKLTTEILNVMNNKLLVGGIFCDLKEYLILLVMVSCYLNWNFLESVARILYFINYIWITGILEQQCIMTVIKFQAGQTLDMESHKALFWDLYFFFYIYKWLTQDKN